mmetsp:Transcript_9488/g.14289  ORF Transcript_9488/g.14289 Transcript_9488/m.14289 type:complete len:89 (-) Transcript_9488:626-892(-)
MEFSPGCNSSHQQCQASVVKSVANISTTFALCPGDDDRGGEERDLVERNRGQQNGQEVDAYIAPTTVGDTTESSLQDIMSTNPWRRYP